MCVPEFKKMYPSSNLSVLIRLLHKFSFSLSSFLSLASFLFMNVNCMEILKSWKISGGRRSEVLFAGEFVGLCVRNT